SQKSDTRKPDAKHPVRSERARPLWTIDPKPVREPEERRRQERRHIPVDKIQEEYVPLLDVHRRLEAEGGQSIRLERRKDAEQRRGSEHPPKWGCPRLLHLLTTIRAL